MTNDVLNTKLLKSQQLEIEQLKRDTVFWKDLCKKLSQPITKEEETSCEEPK